MAWTLCSSGAAIAKAGANANADLKAYSTTYAAIIDNWSDEAEGFVNSETRRDWISSPASNQTSGAIVDVVSAKIANNIISYDMSGYTSRSEAQTMLDVNENTIRQGLANLTKKENQEKM